MPHMKNKVLFDAKLNQLRTELAGLSEKKRNTQKYKKLAWHRDCLEQRLESNDLAAYQIEKNLVVDKPVKKSKAQNEYSCANVL